MTDEDLTSEVMPWDDECWECVATADVEDGGKFYECAIYKHKVGGGHCIYFGEDEYEGMGTNQECGTYSFKDGVLKDSDGDVIQVKNVEEGKLPSPDYAPSTESSSEDSDSNEYAPASRRRGQGRSRGRRGRRRGRGGRGRGRRSAQTRGRGRRGTQGRGRGRQSAGERGRQRTPLATGQYECDTCHIRSRCEAMVQTCHSKHLPWCNKYAAGTACTSTNFELGAAKEEVRTCLRLCLCVTYILAPSYAG